MQKINLVLAIALLIFTREVGIILIFSLILHKFLTLSQKFKSIIAIVTFLSILVSLNIDFLQELLHTLIWNATNYRSAYELVYNYNLFVLVDIFLEKVSDPRDVNTIIESLVLAFIPTILFCILGFIRWYRIKNNTNRKKIMSHVIFLYFITYFWVFILFKIGRGLDRFWIPILLFPLFLLPFTVDIEELINSTLKLMSESFRWIYNTTIQRQKETPPTHISSSFFKLLKKTFNVDNKSMVIFPRTTFHFIVISQVLFYIIRLILSLIVTGVLPVYQ
ncbi:MAG: hypothetical protein ACFFDI_28340 [Promethearchaeota archaeon]